MKKLTALFLVFSVLALSGNLFAKGRTGADLIVQKKDRTQVRGELIAVKRNSLLLLDSESGRDVSVDIIDLEVIIVKRKFGWLEGLIPGLALGLGSGYLWADATWGASFIFTMPVGLLIGLGIGAVVGTDKTIQIKDKSGSEIKEILKDLRSKARVRNFR